jgi:hypothetical protein
MKDIASVAATGAHVPSTIFILFFIIIAPLFMGWEDGTLLLRKRSKHTPPAIKQVKYARSSS